MHFKVSRIIFISGATTFFQVASKYGSRALELCAIFCNFSIIFRFPSICEQFLRTL